ncbi:MAG: hypothetical protein MUF55_11785 [Hydrogenophaga sp.]|nr:hypothetical protein [Hydrogenophaga sp.]
MLNIPSTTAVSWTTPPASTQIGPVAPVQAVTAASRDRQAGLGAGQDGHSPARTTNPGRAGQAKSQPEPAAAPLLPRDTKQDPAGVERAQEVGARQEQQQQRAAQELAEQEAEQALRDKLQSVLTTVWQASAAVVERALGREPANELPGPQSDTSPDLSVARRPLPPEAPPRPQAEPLPWPIMQGGAADAGQAAPAVPLAPEEVVSYDEKGNTSAAPLEVGSLISRRV